MRRWTSSRRCCSSTRGPAIYRVAKYPVGDFFGPVDLGLHLSGRFNSLNIGVGLLAGSILPGSNRLVVHRLLARAGAASTSRRWAAPAWCSTTSAINMLSIVGKGARRRRSWSSTGSTARKSRSRSSRWTCRASGRPGRRGVYGLLDHVHETLSAALLADPPRILAVGPAAASTDFGGDRLGADRRQRTRSRTWTRGRDAAASGTRAPAGARHRRVIYGGTVVDEDFRDRKVADDWFQDRVPEAAGRQGLRGDDEVPLRPEASTRAARSASTSRRSAARCSRSTTAAIY